MFFLDDPSARTRSDQIVSELRLLLSSQFMEWESQYRLLHAKALPILVDLTQSPERLNQVTRGWSITVREVTQGRTISVYSDTKDLKLRGALNGKDIGVRGRFGCHGHESEGSVKFAAAALKPYIERFMPGEVVYQAGRLMRRIEIEDKVDHKIFDPNHLIFAPSSIQTSIQKLIWQITGGDRLDPILVTDSQRTRFEVDVCVPNDLHGQTKIRIQKAFDQCQNYALPLGAKYWAPTQKELPLAVLKEQDDFENSGINGIYLGSTPQVEFERKIANSDPHTVLQAGVAEEILERRVSHLLRRGLRIEDDTVEVMAPKETKLSDAYQLRDQLMARLSNNALAVA